MNKNPEISVIVPVYNIEKYITACVNSILEQTFADFEVILVNDGSTDNSASICDDLSAIDNRVTVIHKQNGGPSAARNCGVDKACGNYFFFVDGDDFIDKNSLKSFIDVTQKNSDVEVVLSSGIYSFYPDRIKLLTAELDLQKARGSGENVLKYILKEYKNDLWSIYCKLYSARFWRENEYKFKAGIDCGEDLELVYRIMLEAKNIESINQPCYYYRQSRLGSIITERSRKKIIDICVIIGEWSDYLNSHSLDKELVLLFRNRLAGIFCTSVLSQIYFYPQGERRELLERITKIQFILDYADSGISLISKRLIKIIGLNSTCFILNVLRKVKKALIRD